MSFATLSSWLSAAAHDPLMQAVAILLATFVLEDGATVLTAIAVGDGTVGWAVGLGALYVGIVLGDAGLYGLGRLAALWSPARRWAPRTSRPANQSAGEKTSGSDAAKSGRKAHMFAPPTDPDSGIRWWTGAALFRVVFLCRFLPGTRLPIYTASGFFNAGFGVFLLATAIATLFWTTALFALSLHLGRVLLDALGPWRWVGIAGFLAAIVFASRQVARRQSLP